VVLVGALLLEIQKYTQGIGELEYGVVCEYVLVYGTKLGTQVCMSGMMQ